MSRVVLKAYRITRYDTGKEVGVYKTPATNHQHEVNRVRKAAYLDIEKEAKSSGVLLKIVRAPEHDEAL